MGNVKGTERIFGDEPLAKMKTQNIQKGWGYSRQAEKQQKTG
jgi:hypothetical protein